MSSMTLCQMPSAEHAVLMHGVFVVFLGGTGMAAVSGLHREL